MLTKVQRWGSGLGVRIPKLFAKELAVEEGSPVDISVSEGRFVMQPIQPRKYDLRELLAQVTEENLHGEIATGEPNDRESG